MEELFSNVLTASLHGGIVIAVVLLLRLALRKAPKKYICLLWLLAFARLLMPFEIQSKLSLQPDTSAEWRTEALQTEPAAGGMHMPVIRPDQNAAAEPEPVVHRSQSPADPAVGTEQAAEPVRTEPVQEPFDWQEAACGVWLAVVCGFGVCSLVSYLRLKRKVREAVKTLGCWECAGIETAFILGFLKPKIYIPMGMSLTERHYILEHERTHLDRGDHWFKLVGYAALAIHWFNPLVWAGYVLLCRDIEMACDERVVQFMELEERKEYSAALLSCSSSRAHFTACPVAFGEVSVKERIMSVLNYKKPGFWISLVSVIAILFVAVCLLTNPAGKPDEDGGNGNAGETLPEETEPAAEGPGFDANLSESEILDLCRQALEELNSRESFHVHVEETCASTSNSYGNWSGTGEVRKDGENFLTESYDSDGRLSIGYMIHDGQFAMSVGGSWIWNGESHTDWVKSWLEDYSPEGKQVGFPEGTGVVSGDTVAFYAEWEDEDTFLHDFDGTFSFTFRADGSLASICKEFGCSEDDGSTLYYTQTLTVVEESPEETGGYFQALVEQVVTEEELDWIRLEQELVTEVPSNKTQYDKDFALGAGTMGWRMMRGEWFFKFGAENVTNTGLKLVVEYSEPYDLENTGISGQVTAGTEYFIERLEDGQWVTVPTTAETFTPIPEKTLGTGGQPDHQLGSQLWKASRRILPHRQLLYLHSDSGETDTQVCYAKFRLYDPNHDALLKQCSQAMDSLRNRDSFHISSYSWKSEKSLALSGTYVSKELWKHGADYLQARKNISLEDPSQVLSTGGEMWLDGKYYGLSWEGEDPHSPVSGWWLGVDGYLDDSNFETWTYGFEWYDSAVELVYQQGNTIYILQSYFSSDYPYSELAFTFDKQGNLTGLVKSMLPSLNCTQAEKVVDGELTVYSTDAQEAAEIIDRQDVSTPMSFSYAEDAAQYPDAVTTGFRNTGATTVTTPDQARALADKECTLPVHEAPDMRYYQSRVCYDPEAKMWRVELFWWQDFQEQFVYLDEQGITRMVVTCPME